jgi:hypothetical protein
MYFNRFYLNHNQYIYCCCVDSHNASHLPYRPMYKDICVYICMYETLQLHMIWYEVRH